VVVVVVSVVVVVVVVVVVGVTQVPAPSHMPSPQGAKLKLCWQAPASQLSSVQGLLSSQSAGIPGGWHVLSMHVWTPVVQKSWEQSPSAVQQPVIEVCTHPDIGSQESMMQGEWELQSTESCTHPDIGSQLSVVQASWSSQLSGAPGWHTPVPVSHVPPGLQTVLQSESCWQQPPTPTWSQSWVISLHVSVVQTLPSSQLTGVPCSHIPVVWLQVTPPLQNVPPVQVSV